MIRLILIVMLGCFPLFAQASKEEIVDFVNSVKNKGINKSSKPEKVVLSISCSDIEQNLVSINRKGKHRVYLKVEEMDLTVQLSQMEKHSGIDILVFSASEDASIIVGLDSERGYVFERSKAAGKESELVKCEVI